jgi:hypothetical protein
LVLTAGTKLGRYQSLPDSALTRDESVSELKVSRKALLKLPLVEDARNPSALCLTPSLSFEFLASTREHG